MIRLVLYLYAFSLPFAYLWDVMFGFTTQLKPYRLAGIALIGLFLVAIANGRARLRLDRYDRSFIALFVLGAILAAFWRAVEGTSAAAVPHMLMLVASAFLPYLIIKNLGLTQARIEQLLRTYVVGVCASIVVSLALGTSVTEGRFVAFLDNPNRMAFALAVSLHFLLGQIVFGRRRSGLSGYVIRAGIIIGIAILLIFTGSRAALVATALSVVVYAIPLLHRNRGARAARMQRVATLLPIVLLAGGVVSSVYDTFEEDSTAIQRYEVTGDSGYSGRLDLWRGAWAVTVDHYFIGVGTAQYRAYHREYMAKLDGLYSPSLAEKDLMVHSDYFEMLTSAGILGLVLFLAMITSLYRRLSLKSRSLAHEHASLPALALPLLILVLTFGVFHTQIYDPQYYFSMAIIMLIARGLPSGRSRYDIAARRLRPPLSAST